MQQKENFFASWPAVRKIFGMVFQDPRARTAGVVGGLGLLLLNFWLFRQVTTVTEFIRMAQAGEFGSWSVLYAVVLPVFHVLTALFFACSLALLVWQFAQSRLRSGKTWGAVGAGGFVSALGAACPVCGAFFLQLLGIVGGVSLFPFKGLELPFVSAVLLGSVTWITAKRVASAAESGCAARKVTLPSPFSLKNIAWEKWFLWFLIAALGVNQWTVIRTARAFDLSPSSGAFTQTIRSLFTVEAAAAKVIIAPKLNEDGKTTSLMEQPTMTEVPGNPQTGDALADAKVVMIPSGAPFYAPEGISFDDPIAAQKGWGAMEKTVTLSDDLETRYQGIVNMFTCNYCCGSPTRVTVIARCGCQHAKAWRGMAKHLLQNYGGQYTDEEIMGEMYRWTGIWYPEGVIQDYLLVTGNEQAYPHKSHGGAGNDGRHGL